MRKTANVSTLKARAGRIALQQRRAQEERGRIKDVIGDWGAPGVAPSQVPPDDARTSEWLEAGGTKGYERKLRKVAQRGVVKLFNAIRAAQSTSVDDIDKARAQNTSRKTNALGSKDTALNELSKSNFLDLLRGGPRDAQA